MPHFIQHLIKLTKTTFTSPITKLKFCTKRYEIYKYFGSKIVFYGQLHHKTCS